MGWLMKRAEEVHGSNRSFREMARQLKELPEWPRVESIKASSLGTYLGEIDKGRKLEWFQERPKVREALARFLEFSTEELENQLEELTGASGRSERQLQFWDVDIRPIDLRKEEPPPVFPRQVLDTSYWPVLWRAPSGSGRTLVGRWLEAQGVARFIQAENWAEALSQLSGGERAFIELMSPDGLPSSPDLWEPALSVCLAVDGAPRRRVRQERVASLFSDSEEPEFTWNQVRSPPPEEWLEPLVAWIDERLPKAADFDAKACLEWMRTRLLPQRVLDGFGTVLGFIGLFTRYHKNIRRIEAANPWTKLAELFLRMRRDQVETRMETEKAPVLLERLTHLAQAVLRQSERPLHEARGWDEWLELARSSSDEPALAYLREVSARHSLQVNERNLQRAVEKVPPSAHYALRSLKVLQVLREKRPQLHALQPRWLFTTLVIQAAESLLDQSHEAWGTALLRVHGARFVMGGLIQRCHRGDFKPVQRLLEVPQLESPTWVAALECAFRVLGITVLQEPAKAPRELLSEVLMLQQRVLIERNGWPHPRISYGHDVDYPPLKYGMWLLAAHVLVEQLGTAPAMLLPTFLLQKVSGPESVLGHLLWQVWSAVFEESTDESLKLRVLSFYGRLLPRTGPITNATSRVHQLQFPAFLLTRLQAGELDWSDLEDQDWSKLFALLPKYAAQHHQPWEPVVDALWRAWLAAGKDAPWWFSLDHPWAQELWSLVPPEVMTSARIDWVLRHERFPYERLSEKQWSALLARWKSQPQRDFSEQASRAWRHMPARFIRQAIEEDLIAPHENSVLRQIWKTAASTVREEVASLLQEGKWERAMTLAWSAPPEESVQILAILRKATSREDAPRAMCVSWLHQRITDRVPEWEQAWQFLNELTGLNPGPR